MTTQTNQTQALARKHRPTRFTGPDGLRDQDHVSQTLKRAVATGRIAQAYLLAGPRGTGKTTVARVMAAALNCDNRMEDGEPCGQCTNCLRITTGRETMDVIEIDAASNRGIDDIRQLREQTMYAPSQEGKFKIYIVDEAHMLTKEAWNGMLKTLEEPPPHVVFFFCTTEAERIESVSEAVMSRLQRHNLNRISEAMIVDQLRTVADREQIAIAPDALELIAHLSKGGMRDALSLLDEMRTLHVEPDRRITSDDIRQKKGIPPEQLHLGAIDILAKGDTDENRGRVFDLNRLLNETGNRYTVFLSFFQNALIDLQALRSGKSPSSPWSEKSLKKLASYQDRLSGDAITAVLNMTMSYREDFASSEPQIAFFAFMQSAITEVSRIQRMLEEEALNMTMGAEAPTAEPPAPAPGAHAPRRAVR